MTCWVCGTTEEHDFSLYHNKFLCDACLSLFNYYYNEALKETQRLNNTPENEFIEALEQYVNYKGNEYNENLRKERTDGNI